jgi:hypothetical protein
MEHVSMFGEFENLEQLIPISVMDSFSAYLTKQPCSSALMDAAVAASSASGSGSADHIKAQALRQAFQADAFAAETARATTAAMAATAAAAAAAATVAASAMGTYVAVGVKRKACDDPGEGSGLQGPDLVRQVDRLHRIVHAIDSVGVDEHADGSVSARELLTKAVRQASKQNASVTEDQIWNDLKALAAVINTRP